MIDITKQMLEFKEAIRHTWNSHFANSKEPMSSGTQSAFSDIERALLRVIVLAPAGRSDLADAYRTRVLPEVLVKPVYVPGQMPIQFGSKEPNGNTVWELETLLKVDEATEFHFYDFFDWQPFGHVDLPFVRVREAPQDKSRGGRIALIEQRHCRFILIVNQEKS